MRLLRGLLTKLGLLVGSLAVVLFAAEMVVRLLFQNISTTADNSSYFARRWKDSGQIRLNSMGFREREFEIIKPVKTYRIAVIGDSVTFGQGIAERDRYSNVLETLLNNTHGNERKYEVLNFGRIGAETIDHIAILKELLPHTDPDVVILQWFVNDFEGHDKTNRPSPVAIVPSWRIHAALHGSSAVYYLLNQQWISLQGNLGLVESYADYMRRRFGDAENMESRRAIEKVREFIRLCRDGGIRVGLVLFPSITRNLQNEYPFEFLHGRVLEVCSKEGITCVDLRSSFASYKDTTVLWTNRFDPHPGPEANRIASHLILEVFGHLWLPANGDRIATRGKMRG